MSTPGWVVSKVMKKWCLPGRPSRATWLSTSAITWRNALCISWR